MVDFTGVKYRCAVASAKHLDQSPKEINGLVNYNLPMWLSNQCQREKPPVSINEQLDATLDKAVSF